MSDDDLLADLRRTAIIALCVAAIVFACVGFAAGYLIGGAS